MFADNFECNLEEGVDGAFRSTWRQTRYRPSSGAGVDVGNISFKASNVVPTGQENKPYSIKMLYLIAY